MASGSNIPYVYSDKANLVSPKDWNNHKQLEYHIEDLATTADSPYSADFTIINFEIDADSADFEFNLPALSSISHPDITNFRARCRITNVDTSSYNVNVNPDGTDKIRGDNSAATLEPGETIDIESLPGGWQ